MNELRRGLARFQQDQIDENRNRRTARGSR
jgi:hypothetical protein